MKRFSLAAALVAAALPTTALAGPLAQVGRSPWGASDEIGRLNMMTPATRSGVMRRADGSRAYDLSVDYFIGMPSWHGIGDPRYQFWLTHTPRGATVDDPMKVGRAANEHVSYTGDAVSMYTHSGTHIDALNHFGLDGRIYNGFAADEHLGDKGWRKAGAETIPPIVARGILIDVAAARNEAMLPDNFRVGRRELEAALARQGLAVQRGDVVLIRTGRMAKYEQGQPFIDNAPGLDMDGARYLVERGAMVIGADNLSFEAFPSNDPANYIPVHTFLLAEHGVPIIELAFLEELSRDGVYEFAFIGGSLKFRGASAAPMRPIALPLRRRSR